MRRAAALTEPKRRTLLALGAALALATVVRLYDLTGESLWYDEAYSVWTSAMDIASLKVLWGWRIEFPLYYLLLHYWMRLFGQGEFAVRALSALAGVLTIIPMYLWGKALCEARAGLLGALLLAVNPYHVWYSQEVRMYAWAVLFAQASLCAYWRILRDGRARWWIAHVLLTGLTFHLHYYVAWILLVENVFLLWALARRYGGLLTREAWRDLRLWLLDQAAVAALAAPAVVVFLTKLLTLNQWGWLAGRYGAPTPANVLDLFSVFTVGLGYRGPGPLRWIVLLVALGLAALAAANGSCEYRQQGYAETESSGDGVRHAPAPEVFPALLVALPLALLFAIGQFTAVWVPRYLLLFLPAFLLLAAVGLARIRPWAGIVLSVVLLGGSLFGLAGMYGQQQKEDWRGLAGYLSQQGGEGDVVVLVDAECRVPLDYYDQSDIPRVEVSRFADEAALDTAMVQMLGHRPSGSSRGRVFLVISHADESPIEAVMDGLASLRREEARDLVGIRVVTYVWS